MEVKQMYDLLNTVVTNATSGKVTVKEDLSNITDVGQEIFDGNWKDPFLNKLLDKISRVKISDRVYSGKLPDLLWEESDYAAVTQKIRIEIPQAQESQKYNQHGRDKNHKYDEHLKFHGVEVQEKFFNSREVADFWVTLPKDQVQTAFNSVGEMGRFISAVNNTVDKAITISIDGIVQRTVNGMMAATIQKSFEGVPEANKSSVQAVNLLHLYQTEKDETLTDPTKALQDPEFLRFAASRIAMYSDFLVEPSVMFNQSGKLQFTPKNYQHLIMLSHFQRCLDYNLYADTYNPEKIAMPDHYSIGCWQGLGENLTFEEQSKINIKNDGKNGGEVYDIEMNGIIGVLFDHEALGIFRKRTEVNSEFNITGKMFNTVHTVETAFFNDPDENFIVFFVK